MTISLSILILTHNEEQNLEFLLKSIYGWVEAIFIVDSGSTDRTLEIAANYGAHVEYHPWTTHAVQFNWGLDNMPIATDWVMRMDADEYITPELASELQNVLPNLPADIGGLYVKRQIHFGGRWIRHGGLYPVWMLRIFRNKLGRCEARWMDEHIVVNKGRTIQLKHDIVDENHKDLRFFTLKHEDYAWREAIDLAKLRPTPENEIAITAKLIGGHQEQQKRWLKGSVYSNAPLFWRAMIYFIYRYVFRLGFLDGIPGLIFHVLQGFWYRFYVDAKLWEMQDKSQ